MKAKKMQEIIGIWNKKLNKNLKKKRRKDVAKYILKQNGHAMFGNMLQVFCYYCQAQSLVLRWESVVWRGICEALWLACLLWTFKNIWAKKYRLWRWFRGVFFRKKVFEKRAFEHATNDPKLWNIWLWRAAKQGEFWAPILLLRRKSRHPKGQNRGVL